MSSQTPNINLTLPTGAENVSRQIINDNNTKIDTAIGTLNDNIKRTVLTTATDFNTLRVTGNSQNQYYCGDNLAIHSNIPTGIGNNVPFTLDVVSMGSYSVQILKTYASSGGPKEYKRQTYYTSGSTPYNAWTSLDNKITIIDYAGSNYKTTTTGYFTIPYPTGMDQSSHIYMLVPEYLSGGLTGYSYTVQRTSSNIVVYIRVGTDLPQDNSKVAFRLVCIKV